MVPSKWIGAAAGGGARGSQGWGLMCSLPFASCLLWGSYSGPIFAPLAFSAEHHPSKYTIMLMHMLAMHMLVIECICHTHP